jgi:hypothetical protein
MDHMVIRRIASRNDGMFGAVTWNNLPFAVTVERPWLDNQTGISCIPAGHYICKRCRTSPDYGFRDSPKFGDTFQVMNVPGRSLILFHKGNLDEDSHGCIILGEQYEPFRSRPAAVLSSAKAFEEFKSLTHGIDEFLLDIVDCTAVPR